jgi:hypothetical protein
MDQLVVFVRDAGNWIGIAGAIAFVGLLGLVYYLQGYRHMEKAMARRKEKQDVAQIVSDALQDACHQGLITATQWHKYNKKLARCLGLPDMLPKTEFDPKRAKALAYIRLSTMGVNIAEGLSKLRRRRTSKLDRLHAALKK